MAPGSSKRAPRSGLGHQGLPWCASYGLGGGRRGWSMGHFGNHFGIYFCSLFGPFWCLYSGAFLASVRGPLGHYLGSILEAFLDQNRAKSGRESGPEKACPREGDLGQNGLDITPPPFRKCRNCTGFKCFLMVAASARGVGGGVQRG